MLGGFAVLLILTTFHTFDYLMRGVSVWRFAAVKALCWATMIVAYLFFIVPAADAFEWPQRDNAAFRPGESISYEIKYGFIHAGSASMDVVAVENVGDRHAYYVKSTARTNKTVDAFYKVRDVNETWIDTQSICSLKSSQQMREGHYQSDKVTENNHAAGTFAFKKRNRGWWHDSAGPLPQFSQDILSALYYLRTLPIEAGRSYEMSVVSGGETWPLVVHVRGMETVSVAAGRFECWRLEPVLLGEGLFLNVGSMQVWVTRDDKKIPVLLRSGVAVGSFDAEMTGYRGGM